MLQTRHGVGLTNPDVVLTLAYWHIRVIAIRMSGDLIHARVDGLDADNVYVQDVTVRYADGTTERLAGEAWEREEVVAVTIGDLELDHLQWYMGTMRLTDFRVSTTSAPLLHLVAVC